MKRNEYLLWRGVLTLLVAQLTGAAHASSHMDAPLITRDPSANTTDVYAFVNTNGGQKYLTVALGVYPFEEPGIGPNLYNFDDNVLYQSSSRPRQGLQGRHGGYKLSISVHHALQRQGHKDSSRPSRGD